MTTQQNTRPDPLTTLAALRPDTSGRAWGAVEQAAARERVMAAPVPSAAPVRRVRGRRSHVTAIALGGVLVVGGASAAAAAGVVGGLLPQSFTDVFSSWGLAHHNENGTVNNPALDLSTAQRVATAPGPDGTIFTVVVAHAGPGVDYQCSVALNETPDSAQRPLPSNFLDVSATSCGSEVPDPRFSFQGGWADLEHGTWSWFGTAGAAVRGDVVTASGQHYPAVISDGRIYGWYPRVADQADSPVLTCYDADGTVVVRENLETGEKVA